MDKKEKARWIKSAASKAGFMACGISKAEFLEDEARNLEKWLKKGNHGKMQYMENYFDKRVDPRKLVPGAKSVISLLLNYYPPEGQERDGRPKISKYAYGEDYHFVMKRKMKTLFKKMEEEFGEISGRAFVDSAPVMDKAWAERSGLGWIGKNTNILNKQTGSFFFIGEIISDLEPEFDGPAVDHCGTCTRCIDHCPTDAITEPYVVDGSKCISYLTIELKESIPEEFKDQMEGWAFGCDICQDVCPWNKFSKPHDEEAFGPSPNLIEMTRKSWENLTREEFNKKFKKSPLKRAKFEGIKENVRFLPDPDDQ